VGKSKDISLEERARILSWAQEGVKAKEIATRLGRNLAAIKKHLAKLRDVTLNMPR
jgi:IS30 family transposase